MPTLTHGAGAARNRGLEAARAPLVVFLDADDVLTPGALETMLQAYVDSGGHYVYSDWAHLEDEARLDGPIVPHSVPEFDQHMWLEGAQHAVTCLIEAEQVRAVGGFDEQLPAWEDWDFLIKLAIAGVCGAHVAAPLLIYRLRTGQRRNVGDAKEQELLAAIRDRYMPYGTGVEQMGTCCGGKANVMNMATTALDEMFGNFGFSEPEAPINPNAPVRLEYIGDEWGEQVWFSQDRQRQYKAGRDPSWRYVDAAPEDVHHLLSFGKFARVIVATPETEDDEGELVPSVPPEPRAQPRERQRGRRV